jgi:beta-aspartyl-peptidase (threonine type)
MDDGRHLMLAGEGALMFAREIGFPECRPETLIVDREKQRWESKHGTVGCVALDSNGHLAVATSTGGIFDKLPGRVGDSPLIGCGTYAGDYGAASCTGQGEAIIRTVLGKSAVDLLKAGVDRQSAAEQAVALLEEKTGGTGGLILIDRQGKIGYARNTTHMPVCWITNSGQPTTDS